MTRRLWITLSVALMAGSASAAIAPGQLERIEAMIEQGDWVALRGYLGRNPKLLRGDDALANELRRFMTETDSLYTALVFDPSVFPDTGLAELAPPAAPVVRDPPSRSQTPEIPHAPAAADVSSVPLLMIFEQDEDRYQMRLGRDRDRDQDARQGHDRADAEDDLAGGGADLSGGAAEIY